MDSDDYVVVDEDKEPNFFISEFFSWNNSLIRTIHLDAPVKPQPLNMARHSNHSLFSPATNSQRESFSSDIFFPGTPLMSPTIMPNQRQPPLSFGSEQQQAFQLDSLARLASSLSGSGLKLPMMHGQQIQPPQTTASSFDALTRQNELLFSSAASTIPTTTQSTTNNNNSYKESLNNLLIEQQLIQNLQKLQQLLQSPAPVLNNTNLLSGLLNLPLAPQQQSTPLPPQSDLLAQLQLGSNFSSLLQSVLPPPPQQQPMTPGLPNNLTASLAAALDNLARQNAQPPQMFIGGN